jgi:hypothetical protein
MYVGGYIVLDTEGGAVWRIEYVYYKVPASLAGKLDSC